MTTPIQEPELDELYRELILDHYRSPRNRHHIEAPTAASEGYNPLCGDEIEVELVIEDGKVVDAAAIGRGCSISQASGSMMTEALKGRTPSEARDLARAFTAMMTKPDTEASAELGDLEAFQGVGKFAVRVKCATLAWRTLEEALASAERGPK